MRRVPQAMTDRWKAQAKLGDQRPVVRATIQIANLRHFEYDTAWAPGGDFDVDRHRTGTFTSMLFGDRSAVREIRNIKTCEWQRSVDQDVATCTLTISNTDLQPIGNPDEGDPNNDRIDMPGYFTYNRGQQTKSQNRWGYDTETGWQDIFVPDRLVKTYEGYGIDRGVRPAEDTNLVQTGTWLIDKVTYTADGDLTLEMRDLGRLLLQQIVFPPVIPRTEYPLSWSTIHTAQVPHRDVTGGSWSDKLRGQVKATSSNDRYVGKDIDNPPYQRYVSSNGGVSGHHASHALEGQSDDSGRQYWLSTGQETRNSKVWWQAEFDNPVDALAAIRVACKHGPYRIYVSVANKHGWIGRKKIPYDITTEDVNLRADIPFVQMAIVDRGTQDIILKRVYKGATKVRLTFSHLWDSRVGTYPWQAALRDFRIYSGPVGKVGFKHGQVAKVVGNYRDYTDIVKWVCAWGGFYWPAHSTGMDFVRTDWGPDGLQTFSYEHPDNALPRGRVWGDLQHTGTAGVADLTVDMFDKKPLMDVVNYVRDLTGFLFFVDEFGSIVWRMPNIGLRDFADGSPKLGNYLTPVAFDKRSRDRTTESEILHLDEEETLLEWTTVLSSENIRERVFVANVTGKFGAVVEGFNPYPVGLRRVAGWTDQKFRDKREIKVMADMLNARSMFEYRRGQAVIPGYPGVQIDDQVRVFERVTNETYYHYVLGISSTLDMETGEYTYTLDTHWLGEAPSDAWIVRVEELDNATQNYLQIMAGANADGAN